MTALTGTEQYLRAVVDGHRDAIISSTDDWPLL
jgi:hypothetical protein